MNVKKGAFYTYFSKQIKNIVIITSCIYVLLYVFIVFSRINYPYDLEWIEGGMVDQVQQLIKTGNMYVSPSINFVPFLYPPLFFYFSAVSTYIFGIGYFSLRLVSFIASLVTFIIIFLIVFEETKEWWIAIFSVGIFAATFRVTGAWLDIARVDSLFVAFWTLFVYFIRKRNSYYCSLIAGLFAALAFLTKQTAMIACFPVITFHIYKNWKYGLITLATSILIIGLSTLLLNQLSNGWYFFYVFILLFQQTEWLPRLFVSFWTDDLIFQIPIVVLFSFFFLNNKVKGNRSILIFWFCVLSGVLAGTFLTRVKLGGYDNVLLPLYVALSITFGLGINEFNKKIIDYEVAHKKKVNTLIHMVFLVQLLLLAYNPIAQIPTNDDLQAGNEFVSYISSISGEVFLPDQGYLTTLAGKNAFAHHSAIWDIVRGNKSTLGKEILSEDLDDVITKQYFDVIILDSSDWNYCCEKIDDYYIQQSILFSDTSSFYTLTGWKRRPAEIYLAKRLVTNE